MAGKTVLIVEDEFLVADDMARYFESSGATVLGPVPTLAAAWSIVAREGPLDGAILDINLFGELVFPLIDALRQRGVCCVLSTGYDHAIVPPAYRTLPFCQKPVESVDIARVLFG
ncbi:hypothetical protein NS365_22295 [Aureimonas ureilytica]|uniref:Response regulatory domain-containing protein n=2 Tax=Aureimonas ureilytica TaxID=401562 RepID=A0A175R836_9HYPH|nr:hypothetical protein NS226_15595 [Aureimonas ureilytica]KTR02197.1 hypothetical protein NS365_22295 [Aureimonas ureilytica]